MTASFPPRRKPPKGETGRQESARACRNAISEKDFDSETARQKSARACARHLDDLKRAHGAPPPDVKVRMSSTVRLVVPPAQGSYCTSPAQLCAELAE